VDGLRNFVRLRPIALAKSLLFIALVAAVGLVFAVEMQDFSLVFRGERRALQAILATLPLVWLYIALATVLTRPLAAAIALLAGYVLSRMNEVKFAETGEPLVWSDFSTTANLDVVLPYASALDIGIISLAATAVVASVLYFRRRCLRSSRHYFLTALLLTPLVLHSPLSRSVEPVAQPMEVALGKLGIRYLSFDRSLNVRYNGLFWHVLHTGRIALPDAATEAEQQAYQRLAGRSVDPPARVDEVIVILCEACWHDTLHFTDNFQPLRDRGFKGFRAISPVYGGRTVNAAFELITGLPANGALNGVIYQEYIDYIRASTDSYPAALAENGWNTRAAHNNWAAFWRRDAMLPRLGFDDFLSLEDMPPKEEVWARDRILYDAVFETRDTVPGPTFFFLTSIYGHGPYGEEHDWGEAHFAYKMKRSIQDMAAFTDQVLADNPDALILVLGDHKPSLGRYFHRHGILPRHYFLSVGESNRDYALGFHADPAVVGDVPAYVYHADAERRQALIEEMSGRPFYCLPEVLSRLYTGGSTPVLAYIRESGVCAQFKPDEYKKRSQAFPDWLYHQALFAPGERTDKRVSSLPKEVSD